MSISRIVSILCVLCFFSACDKGRQSLDKMNSEFSSVAKGEINETNSKQAFQYSVGLKAIAMAHSKEASGKDAADQLAELRKKVEARIKVADTAAAAGSKTVEADLGGIIARAILLRKKADSINRLKFNPKKDSCVVENTGREFSKDPDFVNVQIYKILELGKQEMKMEIIYSAKAEDIKYPKAALERTNQTKSDYISLNAGAIIDCKEAEKFAADYKSFLEKYYKATGVYLEEISNLAPIMRDSLL